MSVEESGVTIVEAPLETKIEGDELCKLCRLKEWIYTCPRCFVHTCSLTCVRQHKKETECSGLRDKTAYVPLKKYTESHMMSDYTYLEDVSRQSDNITRSRLSVDKQVKIKSAENRSRIFAKTVNQMGIRYSSLPVGMSRNKLNQSNYSKKLHHVFWSIEVHFCKNSKRQRYLEHSFPGNKTMFGFLENLLIAENPQGKGEYQIMRHETSDFIQAGIDNFVIGLKKEKSARGHFIDITELLHSPFNDVLKDETIIEYPIIYIWLKNDERPADILVLEEKKQLITVISTVDDETKEDKEENINQDMDEDIKEEEDSDDDIDNEDTGEEDIKEDGIEENDIEEDTEG